MKILFIAPLGRDMPSSRMRFWQVCDAWDEATCYRWDGSFPDNIDEYDVVVFHKNAERTWIAKSRELKSRGVKVVLDICDPYYWWFEEYSEMIRVVDKLVTSSEGLKEDVDRTFGISSVCITDRMPYESEFKIHKAFETPVVCWFGLSLNRRPALNQSGELLRRLLFEGVEFTLRIIDEKPDVPYIKESWVEHVRWGLGTIHATLIDSDIALLPSYPGIWGTVKSKNKMATASWAGLPITDGLDYFHVVDLITDYKLRAKEGACSRKVAEEQYDITQSVTEWQQLVLEL